MYGDTVLQTMIIRSRVILKSSSEFNPEYRHSQGVLELSQTNRAGLSGVIAAISRCEVAFRR